MPSDTLAITTPRLHLPAMDRALVADWRRFLFVHYSVPPEVMAPHVPFELELWEGRAFVSLVFFSLEGMRLPGGGRLGRWLFRPLSDHFFLNVRTYVRHRGRDGICFLAEWIPNWMSERLGPLLYGLPYRRGVFACHRSDLNGVGRLTVSDPGSAATLAATYPISTEGCGPCEPGTLDAFLLERYEAYTFGGRSRRRFAVAHPPWRMRSADWVRADTGLIESAFPWFAAATFHGAHVSPGVENVEMGLPHWVD